MELQDSVSRDEARERLEIIHRTLQETRRATIEANPGFFLWGTIFWVQVLATYAIVYLAQRRGDRGLLGLIAWAWIIPGFVGYAFSAWGLSRVWQGAASAFETFATRALTAVWVSVFFGMAALNGVIGLSAGFGGDGHPLYLAMATIVLAVPLMVTGAAYRIRSFTWIAAGFWLGAIAMAAAGPRWAPLVFGLVAGSGFLIAGAILRRESRSPHAE